MFCAGVSECQGKQNSALGGRMKVIASREPPSWWWLKAFHIHDNIDSNVVRNVVWNVQNIVHETPERCAANQRSRRSSTGTSDSCRGGRSRLQNKEERQEGRQELVTRHHDDAGIVHEEELVKDCGVMPLDRLLLLNL